MKTELEALGIKNPSAIHHNLSSARLVEEAVRRKEGNLTRHGAFVANTGKYTGRSPNDKFIVKEGDSAEHIWWGSVNRPIEPGVFDNLLEKTLAYYNDRQEIFVQDCYAGTDPELRLPVRIINECAWHNLFARNMFVRIESQDELANFKPGFTVIHAPFNEAKGSEDGVNSEAYVLVNFSKRLVLIGGTKYAGEIKKSVFSIMNYLLPAKGVLPMHCSSNIGEGGDSALFFGLSGTGKTTLSADPKRKLIGDDEHGWSDAGVFNFEGGCYAKVINLSEEAEPEIYKTTQMFGTVLENVVFDEHARTIDLNDGSLTENTRASYPIEYIPNFEPTGRGGNPKNVVFLTCDAFGVLPPISKLTPEQAQYHFISGYTAKVAGTERGVKEPSATFSACFGAPFMPRHPGVYAKLLAEKMEKNGATCWLLNTGWAGGEYGIGERMKIKHTRAMLNAALEGKLGDVEFKLHPVFGFEYAAGCPDVPAEVMDPRESWSDKDAYDAKAKHLAGLFRENFKQFEEGVNEAVRNAGPNG